MSSKSEHFTSRLPTKRVAADCLIFDRGGRFLLVEPTYKPTWDIPGGVSEVDESPRCTAQREVAEELGLDVRPGRLLAADWIARRGESTEVMAFLFDGGVLNTPVGDLVLPADEVRSARFVSLSDAEQLMASWEYARVAAAVEARSRQMTVYLENGRAMDATADR